MDERTRWMLRLVMTPGLGPVRIARLLDAFGSPERVRDASPAALSRVRGIGEKTAREAARFLSAKDDLVERELDRLSRVGGRAVALGTDAYPPLLREMRGAPPVLFVRGSDEALSARFGVAMVGSRACTAYGIEQAERFGHAMASAGLNVVSGGARGIDSAAHRGALRARAGNPRAGRTVAVLGCGLGRTYPPENKDLFEEIVDRGGALVTELVTDAEPEAKNFPTRNRIIAGMTLGTLVIEAARGSGALITARDALELGREVLAIPGRIDSQASAGSNDLIRRAEAHLVGEPADVIETLESDAAHAFVGTHASATADPTRPTAGTGDPGLFVPDKSEPSSTDLSTAQRAIVDCLWTEMLPDEVAKATGLGIDAVRTELTLLELSGLVRRAGVRVVRVSGGSGRRS